ncbi:hypothetical protein COY95_00835 [Candidatus Woesearchaeota archaeon CG_4_10_14_0_8_um_filter_47_5]|nr:MAG: hypothetical protein COY95_00835 [Candidatus Woesearchaeota archaeon CG_4_10_14_0_8_um_filter_47_5]
MEQKVLVGIILILVLAVVLIVAVPGIIKSMQEEFRFRMCQESILKLSERGKTVIDPRDVEGIFSDFYCPVKKVTIDMSKPEEEIKHQISEEMYGCWKMVFRGTVNPYVGGSGVNSMCVTCTEFTFTHIDKKDEIQGLSCYQAKTNPDEEAQKEHAARVILDSSYQDMSYLDFLQNRDELNIEYINEEEINTLHCTEEAQKKDIIDATKRYVFVWRVEEGTTLWDSLKTPTGVLGGVAIVGGILFAPVGVAVAAVAIGGGVIGGHYVTTNLRGHVVSSDGFLIPEEMLAKKFEFTSTQNGKEITEERDFCTILVN